MDSILCKKDKIKKSVNIAYKRSGAQKVVFAVAFILLLVYAVTLIYPFIWMFLSSLKEQIEYSVGNTFAFPKEWLFSNYLSAIQLLEVNDTGFIGMVFNSVWITVLSTCTAILISCMTGYVMCHYNFKGRGFIYATAIVVMVIPIVGALPAQYKLIGDLKLYDNPLFAIVCSTAGFGFNFLVLYGFFKGISWNYAEAAFVDGASHTRVFFQIMLPMARPAILSLAILSAIGCWNDYLTPIMYLPSFPNLSSGLFSYANGAIRLNNYPVYFAGVILSIIPVLVLFAFFQNTIMESVTTGGLKG